MAFAVCIVFYLREQDGGRSVQVMISAKIPHRATAPDNSQFQKDGIGLRLMLSRG